MSVPGEAMSPGGLRPNDLSLAHGSVICIGVFDGVHRGHRAVIDHARRIADGLAVPAGARVPVVAVTFHPHPRAVLQPSTAPASLSDIDTRVDLLREAGCAGVLVLPFTPELAAMSPEAFVEDVLVGRLAARAVVVGRDFRFGARARGDVDLLTQLGASEGFTVAAVGTAGDGEQRWSSSRARDQIAAGEVARAAEILGRPYSLTGTVVAGQRRGRDLGFPTANIAVDPGLVIPADGVYAAWAEVAGERWPAAVSVGTNPQFAGRERTVEAYLIDAADVDLYDRELTCAFVARVRGQLVFPTVADLVDQMHRDVEQCRALLAAP